MSWPFSPIPPLAAALLAGMLVPLQTGANASLGRMLGHPLSAVLISLGLSFLVVAGAIFTLRTPWPVVDLSGSPAWIWLGGIFGALFVTAAVATAPHIGAATFVAAVVVGQLVMAFALDHFGLMNFPHRPFDMPRLAGLLAIFAGLISIHGGSND